MNRLAMLILTLAVGCGGSSGKKIGEACGVATDCASARCSDQVCKPAHPAELGQPCQQNLDCRSERCQAGACAQGQRAAGAPCEHWQQCASGDCTQGICGGKAGDGSVRDLGPLEAGARDATKVDGKGADARPADRPRADYPLPDTVHVLDLCEKLAQSEGLTCKPLAVQTITINQILTAGCYQAQDLRIDSAGTLRLQTDLSNGGKPTTIIAKTITVDMGGVITGDSEGFGGGAGPGAGGVASSGLGSGGGHGGTGGPIGSAPGGAAYDSSTYPTQPGSGGGGSNGGKGGGAIRLCAATRITVEGYLFARGQTTGAGGGGGSLLLISPELVGAGTIDASGGKPTSSICGGIGGGGGGGRIALRAASNTFTGATNVPGGTTTCYSGTPSGQPGSIYKGSLP